VVVQYSFLVVLGGVEGVQVSLQLFLVHRQIGGFLLAPQTFLAVVAPQSRLPFVDILAMNATLAVPAECQPGERPGPLCFWTMAVGIGPASLPGIPCAVPKLLFDKRLVLALNPPAFTVRQLSQVETVLGKNELSNRGLLATADSLTGWSGHAEPVCESMAGTEAPWVLVDRHRRRERLPED
jgi:hypothetical protein